MTMRLLLQVIFFLPGTFLHELAHYLCALAVGRAEGFSLIPRVEGGLFIFGRVLSRTRYKVLSSLVAAAPLLWWIIVVMIMIHFRRLSIRNGLPEIDFSGIPGKESSWGARIFAGWLILQVLWAGRLSAADIVNVMRGLFSVSGFVLLGAALVLVYFVKVL